MFYDNISCLNNLKSNRELKFWEIGLHRHCNVHFTNQINCKIYSQIYTIYIMYDRYCLYFN